MGETVAEAGWRGLAEGQGAPSGAALTRPVEALTGPEARDQNRRPLPRALSRSRRTSSYAKASEDK